MSSHLRKFEQKHKKTDEIIIASADGYIGEMMGKGKNKQENGTLIVTNHRIAFYRAGIFGEVFETMPLKSITSIERKSILGHRTIVIHTSHDELRFKTFDKDNESALFEAIESTRLLNNQQQSTSSTAAPDAIETLRKLNDLKLTGALSDSEFEIKKAELLARL